MIQVASPFVTGKQIRAARTLLGWRRSDLAAAAGLHVNAVAYWEKHDTLPASEVGCVRIKRALFDAGVMAINSPTIGVCMVRP